MFAKGISTVRTCITRMVARRTGELWQQPLLADSPVELSSSERLDRRLLLKLAETHGPVFRVLDAGQETTCILDLKLGRRFLKENATSLRPITLDLTSLFPIGFMRQMEGAAHQTYRKALIDAINGLDHDEYCGDIDEIAATELNLYADNQGSDEDSYQRLLATLSAIATGCLLRVFFGVRPGTEPYGTMIELFRRLGPHGLVWNIAAAQIDAFADLRAVLLGLAKAESGNGVSDGGSCLLREIARQGNFDDTMLGNLIYMVEMGRYDMRGLLRWISKYAAQSSDLLTRIAKTEPDRAHEVRALAKAFVLETLRMDQSERLMRDVKENIVFDDHVIPKGGKARVCMWESHKDRGVFSDPFTFDPARFLSAHPSQDEFSPFGLDHHQCPFSVIAVNMGMAYLQSLAREFLVAAIGDGPSVRGAYHWEPAPAFSVALKRRHTAGPDVLRD